MKGIECKRNVLNLIKWKLMSDTWAGQRSQCECNELDEVEDSESEVI